MRNPPRNRRETQSDVPESAAPESAANAHWRWRLQSVERMAEHLDPVRFGVKAMYLFGSTQNGTAGPQSDIDLLIHFVGYGGSGKGFDDMARWLEFVPRAI